MLWHYESADGSHASVEWIELRKLMAAGVVTATTRLRRDDQRVWRVAGDTELRPFLRGGQLATAQPTARPVRRRGVLADGDRYSGFSQVVELVYVILGVIELFACWVVLQDAILATQMTTGDRWEARDAALKLISKNQSIPIVFWIEAGGSVLGFVLLLRWLYLSSRNLRELGAEGLRYSPGWLVGCYFVPVVNLWKPYRAMQELWRASAHPLDWELRAAPASIGVWWTAVIVSSMSAYLAMLQGHLADRPELIPPVTYVALASCLVSTLAAFMTVRLVAGITRLQTGGETGVTSQGAALQDPAAANRSNEAPSQGPTETAGSETSNAP